MNEEDTTLDPSDFVLNEQRRATSSALGSLDASPDDATRAAELSEATGVHPELVYGNLENFEKQHKAALTSQLLQNNSYLRQYVDSHPLADKISNDDYGQLDEVTHGLRPFFDAPSRATSSIMAKAFEGFKEGFGDPHFGEWLYNAPMGEEYIKHHRLAASIATAIGAPIEYGGKIFSGALGAINKGGTELGVRLGMDPMSAQRMARDLTGMAEYAAIRPEHGMEVPPKAIEAAQAVGPYLEAGKEPPLGVHPEIDKLKVKESAEDLKDLDEAFKSAQASQTRERNPELFAGYVRQHTDAKVGISPEALVRLYGDKLPEAEDGILGHIPGVREQLESSLFTGADVDIPLADWLAKVDPEVAKELHDDIRVQPGGVTKNQAKGLAEEARLMVEAYHGSPHDFEAFSMEKIGTGEGAQSYGHGLYFAEKPEVAEQYSKLAQKKLDWTSTDPGIAPPGNNYRVRINADKEQFLDHDAVLSQQLAGKLILERIDPRFREHLEDILEGHDQPQLDELTGNEFRQLLERVASEEELPGVPSAEGVELNHREEASKYIAKLGVPGIKYLDQGSRGKPEELTESLRRIEAYEVLARENPERKSAYEVGIKEEKARLEFLQEQTHNFVLFDDSLIKITHKNDQALEAVRKSSGFEPLAQEGELGRKLQLRRADDHERKSIVEEAAEAGGMSLGEKSIPFNLHDELGKVVGNLAIAEEAGGKRLYIDDISGLERAKSANLFGPRAMIDLLQQLKKEFPKAEELTGYRVSGARDKAETWESHGKVSIKLSELGDWTINKLTNEWERLIKETHGAGIESFTKPTEKFSEYETHITEKVKGILARVVPEVEASVAQRVEMHGREVGGAYLTGKDVEPLILVSLSTKDAGHTARHEALHFLKDYGFFKPEEWKALEAEAKSGDWLSKHSIRERYKEHGRMPERGLLEEAIAEEYGAWGSATEAPREHLNKAVQNAFEKLKAFFAEVLSAIKETFGHTPTIDELFERVESGEVGRRAQGGKGSGESKTVAQQLELPQAGTTRLEDRLPFGKGALDNMTVKMFQRYMDLIEKRNAEDLAKAESRAVEDQRKRQTPEWKANRAELRKSVGESIDARPDIAADRLLAEGVLFGDKLPEKPKLDADKLSVEQKAALPKEYYGKDGADPDDIAGLFGYRTGDAMVERLSQVAEQRTAAGMTPKAYSERLTDIETDRQMEQKYGKLDENILEEAKDQALSETQLDILHQETLALGLNSNAEFSITKEQIREWIKDRISKTKIGDVSSDKYLAAAGRSGRMVERLLLEDDAQGALREKQMQTYASIMAQEARKVEKEREKFEKTAGRFSSRIVPSVPPEYTNFIHEILLKVGKPVKRSIQDLEEAIAESGHKDLRSFVEQKESDYFQEIPIADFLFDPAFRKAFDDLTVEEFQGAAQSVQTLAKQGRDEFKLIRQGEEADRQVILGQMKDQLKEFPLKEYNLHPGIGTKVRKAFRYMSIGLINAETWLNRWDRDNPRGPFNQWVVRPLSEAANRQARLDREFSRDYQAVGEIVDGKKLVDSPFIDPLTITEDSPDGRPFSGFNRENIAAMISNAGNKYNWNILTKGYKADAEATWAWLLRNSTPEDWLRAQKLGEVFDKGFDMAKTVYRNVTGVAPEEIKIDPFTIKFPTGETLELKGWYHPIIEDPIRTDHIRARSGEEQLDKKHSFFASVANAYTKRRTGQVKPLSLDYDQIPAKLNQILHDVSFRQEVIEASKVLRDKGLRKEITKHYGPEYVRMMDDYIRDVAGNAEYSSEVWSKFQQVSNIARGNVISTLIGLNPYTVMKHGPTALVNSMYEAGAKRFLTTFGKEIPAQLFRKATFDLFAHGDEVAEGSWRFALENSEELQRRQRHWSETIAGQHKSIYGKPTLRETIMELGSKPVALSDLISAVPTWTAVYTREIAEGSDIGSATFAADRAVRRAHGSTAITNQPSLVRGGGPMHSWLTSLYGFFGTQMQRRAEIAFQINDIYKLGQEGELKAAAGNVPKLAGLFFATMFWPTLVEEVVQHIGSEDHKGALEKVFYAALGGTASSFLYLRDMAYSARTGQEPSVGLASTPAHHAKNVIEDLKKGRQMFDKAHAGRTVEDFLTAFGDLSGMSPRLVGHAARFGLDVASGAQRPKTPADYALGITKGTMKRRIEK